MRKASDWGGNIIAFVAVIAVNAMANGLPIGGKTTGEVSANYPSLFTPAGFTFSIWGLIYLALTVFIIWQALPAQRGNQSLSQIGVPFKISCLANAIWIFAWHYDFTALSFLLMLLILGSLIQIFRGINASTSILVSFPFSLYMGWITVATIANFSAVQTAWGLNDAGISSIEWTWLKLAVAGTIGAVVVARTRNIVFLLVISWAAFGIYSKQTATPEVAGAAITLSLLALLLSVYTLIFGRSRS